MDIFVKLIENSKLFYSRYTLFDSRFLFHKFILLDIQTTYTNNTTGYLYYGINNKFIKWNENSYIYNPFHRFYSKINLNCKSLKRFYNIDQYLGYLFLDQFQTANKMSIYSTQHLTFGDKHYISVIGCRKLAEFYEVTKTTNDISVSKLFIHMLLLRENNNSQENNVLTD